LIWYMAQGHVGLVFILVFAEHRYQMAGDLPVSNVGCVAHD